MLTRCINWDEVPQFLIDFIKSQGDLTTLLHKNGVQLLLSQSAHNEVDPILT